MDNKYTIQEQFGISAGAGSGKTYTLSRRYINAYLGFDLFKENQEKDFFEKREENRAEIDDIVTITFTNAAANEMKERIFSLMKDVLEATEKKKKEFKFIYKLPEIKKNYIRERLNKALTLSNEAIITTIHGFSLMMIKRYSDYLKINIEDIIDDLEQKSIFEESFTKSLQKNRSKIEVILNDISMYKIKNFSKKYIESVKFKEGIDNFENRNLFELYVGLIKQKTLDKIGNQPEYFDYIDEIVSGEKFTFNKYLGSNKKQFFERELDASETTINKYLNDLRSLWEIDENLEELFVSHLNLLKTFLQAVYDEYQTILGEKLDFNKVITLFYKLLEKKELKFKYVMVDEFQDSNFLQFEIAKKITKDNFFIVGDEKQAIYSFQGGEIEVFKEAQKYLPKTIPMGINYRSDKKIIEFVNSKFKKLFEKRDLVIKNNFCAEFESLTSNSKENGSVEVLYFEKTEELSEKEVEAKNVAKLVQNIIMGEIYPDIKKKYVDKQLPSIGIVYDSKTDMYLLKKELDELGIPAKIKGVEEFWDLEEIKDIIALLKVKSILNKKEFNDYDRFYITSVLNSKLYDYSDKEILDILKDDNLIKEIFEFDEEVLHKFIRKIFISKKAFSKYSNPNSAKANIEEFIKEILVLEEMFDYDLGQILKVLEINFFNGKKNIATYNSPLANAVELSSIHATKGLAYPVIVLMNASKQLKQNNLKEGVVDTKYNDNNYLIGFKVNNYDPLVYRVAKEIDLLKLLEEKKRLLYVALTRPKHHIVVSTKKKFSENSYSNWIDVTSLPEVKLKDNLKIELEEEIMIDFCDGEFDDKIELKTFNINSNFGEAVHKAIELYSDNFTDEKLMKISDIYGIEFEELNKMINNFKNSIEYQELKNADKKEFEWEFEDENGSGRIDLWYEIDGVCKVVDFKTGQPKSEYTQQINRYKQALEKEIGKKVETKLLYLGGQK